MAKNFWIFVIKNTDDELNRRIKKKEWPVYSYTVNRKKIQPGDKVIFYKAGEGNKVCLGTAETASAIKGEEGGIDYTVELGNVSIWKKSVMIKPLISKLEFIGNKEQWGLSMQGGVIHISEKDYGTIYAESK
ncbi:EVE domain-containing protein [Candidatus Nitrosarchaeum limnium]|uniref:EVE domain-containing protein n=1 Tax=Candidatus Nitrosarchaeum limnium TaxID=1007084 RepID=UPI001300C154|nr:EVE domain-containing protein [Candidatus Nitrosarchaeum limnium]